MLPALANTYALSDPLHAYVTGKLKRYSLPRQTQTPGKLKRAVNRGRHRRIVYSLAQSRRIAYSAIPK